VRLSRVAVLARAEPHDVRQLSVRADHLSRETHFAGPRAVDVHEQRHRFVNVNVKTVGVEEIRLDHLPTVQTREHARSISQNRDRGGLGKKVALAFFKQLK